jgi:nucleotide-binding universal stress UspA family protein
MGQTKHSPGPWFVCGDEGHPHVNEAWSEGRTIGDANGLRVADLYAPLKQERIAANARLIAAAPEMVDALARLARRLSAAAAAAREGAEKCSAQERGAYLAFADHLSGFASDAEATLAKSTKPA